VSAVGIGIYFGLTVFITAIVMACWRLSYYLKWKRDQEKRSSAEEGSSRSSSPTEADVVSEKSEVRGDDNV
jgi:hypothetical protein